CCKGKSFYDLFYTANRIKAVNVFNVEAIDVFSYRRQMTLAFAKYCDRKNEYKIVDGEMLPLVYYDVLVDIDLEDPFNSLDHLVKYKIDRVKELFVTCYRVEKLCSYYIQLLKTLRTLNKGAFIRRDEYRGVASVISEELGFLLNSFDERSSKNQLLSKLGGHANISYQVNNRTSKGYCLSMQENINNVTFPLDFFRLKNNDEANPVLLNYVPIFLNLDEYYNYSLNFEKQFSKYYSFTLVDFVIFVSILGQKEFIDEVQSYALLFLCTRAYKIYDVEYMRNDFLRFYEIVRQKHFPESALRDDLKLKRIFDKILNLLIQKPSEIYLNTLTSPALLHQLDDSKLIIDYTSWVYNLERILSPAMKDEDVKGTIFEKIVAKKVEESFGQESVIFKHKEMIAKNGIKIEIDVAFEYKNILIVAECKAVNRAKIDFLGRKTSIEFRKMKVSDALAQLDKTVQNLLLYFERKVIPDNIIGILPILVTPTVEYMWSTDSQYWISQDIPRVISIDEIADLKKCIKYKDIKNKNYFLRTK
ncbi:MAG: hypothetical protein Q8N92_10240, partial [Erysipelotrichaceae bacterium]|nr:hypothetical protein [Erysipelotrichaceae bacterium]